MYHVAVSTTVIFFQFILNSAENIMLYFNVSGKVRFAKDAHLLVS
jgi:hypothetical protein